VFIVQTRDNVPLHSYTLPTSLHFMQKLPKPVPMLRNFASYNYTTVATVYNETTGWNAWGMGL